MTRQPTPSPWPATRMLCWREIIRFLRQRNRLIGALAQPIIFWLLFGTGLQKSFRLADQQGTPSFLEYYFPGTLMLILLFTAIFATISIIEDRKEGFLQGVLIAPVPRWSMVLGKVLGGALIATAQGVVFLLLGWLVGASSNVTALLVTVPLLFLTAVAMTSLGFVIAWRMDSTQGFHAIMNLALMPMWLLSGAFFPIPTLSGETAISQIGLHWVMRLNPLTYAVAGVRQHLFEVPLPESFWAPSLTLCWTVTACFAVGMFWGAWRISSRRIGGDLV
ncbi:MAG: ABC transporter permease [Pirellulaceae bacterium]